MLKANAGYLALVKHWLLFAASTVSVVVRPLGSVYLSLIREHLFVCLLVASQGLLIRVAEHSSLCKNSRPKLLCVPKQRSKWPAIKSKRS